MGLKGKKRLDTSEQNRRRTGEKNPMFGKKRPKHSEFMRERMLGEKNPMFGKKRSDVSDRNKINNPMKRSEVKMKNSKAHLGKKRPDITGDNHPMRRPEQRECMKNGRAVYMASFNNSTEQRKEKSERMLNGGSSYAQSFIKNPSKPQVELFNKVKNLHEDAILNHPCLNYSIDIAIPSLRIAIEYDGSHWHSDEEKDRKRQKEIEQQDWKFIRYKDLVPTKEELKKDLEGRTWSM
jgi:very-short-patch-repair endonuclease